MFIHNYRGLPPGNTTGRPRGSPWAITQGWSWGEGDSLRGPLGDPTPVGDSLEEGSFWGTPGVMGITHGYPCVIPRGREGAGSQGWIPGVPMGLAPKHREV